MIIKFLLNFILHVFLLRISNRGGCCSKDQVSVAFTPGPLNCLIKVFPLFLLVNGFQLINGTLVWVIPPCVLFVVCSPLISFLSNLINPMCFVHHVTWASCTDFIFRLVLMFPKVLWTFYFLMYGVLHPYFLPIINATSYVLLMISLVNLGFFHLIANPMFLSNLFGLNNWLKNSFLVQLNLCNRMGEENLFLFKSFLFSMASRIVKHALILTIKMGVWNASFAILLIRVLLFLHILMSLSTIGMMLLIQHVT